MNKFIDGERRLVVAGGLGQREWGVTANEYKVSFWGDKNFPD
jgi:hypothetical protein